MACDEPPKGPLVLRPEQYCLGVRPATQMLNSDLRLQEKFTSQYWTPGSSWQPLNGTLPSTDAQAREANIVSLRAYLQELDANIIVPDPPAADPPKEAEPAAEPEAEPFWDVSAEGPSRSSEDGGVSTEHRRGVREYLASGYTRTNPDGTREVDNDIGGKWEDSISLVEVSAEHEFFDESVASGDFGNEDDLIHGSGRILGADSSMGSSFEITNSSIKGAAEIQANGSFAEGSIESSDEHLIGGKVEGSVVSADATAGGEIVLTPEQATLKGELGAEVNLVEASLDGSISITPRRIANPLINTWNWAFNGDVEELSENWDIGIMVGGEVSGQVGAQAGAEAELEYADGRATAEAGVKIGLGLGLGVKAKGGIVGADKIWGGITSVWNSVWGD